MAEPMAKFEVYKDKKGEFRWRLVHRNKNIIADSAESYKNKTDAIDGINSVKKNASKAPIVDKTK